MSAFCHRSFFLLLLLLFQTKERGINFPLNNFQFPSPFVFLASSFCRLRPGLMLPHGNASQIESVASYSTISSSNVNEFVSGLTRKCDLEWSSVQTKWRVENGDKLMEEGWMPEDWEASSSSLLDRAFRSGNCLATLHSIDETAYRENSTFSPSVPKFPLEFHFKKFRSASCRIEKLFRCTWNNIDCDVMHLPTVFTVRLLWLRGDPGKMWSASE